MANMRRVQKLLAQCQSTNTCASEEMKNEFVNLGHGTRMLQVIDCHAAGEPARVIVGGLPHIPGDTVSQKRKYMMDHLDHIRLLLLQEPRGYPCQNANAIVPPSSPRAKYGFIIMEQNKIYPAMSGHNTICVATALVLLFRTRFPLSFKLQSGGVFSGSNMKHNEHCHREAVVCQKQLESGMVPMTPDDDDGSLRDDGSFETSFFLEAPAGLIRITALCRNGKAVQITLTNTVSFMDPKYENIAVRLPLPIPSILNNSKSPDPHSEAVDDAADDAVLVDIAYGTSFGDDMLCFSVTAKFVENVDFHWVIIIIYDLWIPDIEFQLCKYECVEYF